MSNRNPDIRRRVDALHYDRMKLAPDRLRAKRAGETRWKKENPELLRGQGARYYERNREMISFKQKLKFWLMRIVRAEEARGRFE